MSTHLSRHFTKNHKCHPHGGPIGQVRGSPKSVGFILWEPWIFVPNSKFKDKPSSGCWGISVWTTVVDQSTYRQIDITTPLVWLLKNNIKANLKYFCSKKGSGGETLCSHHKWFHYLKLWWYFTIPMDCSPFSLCTPKLMPTFFLVMVLNRYLNNSNTECESRTAWLREGRRI